MHHTALYRTALIAYKPGGNDHKTGLFLEDDQLIAWCYEPTSKVLIIRGSPICAMEVSHESVNQDSSSKSKAGDVLSCAPEIGLNR